MMNLENMLLRGLLIASLTSCGGGGGSSRDSGPNPSPQPNPPAGSVSQTASLQNFVDIDYTATLENVDSATRTIYHNSTQIEQRTITNPNYSEIITDLEKGNYRFDLEAPNVTSHSIEREVPNYDPEWDSSSIDPSNLNFNEDEEIRINITAPTDKNPEDNPVLITASSPDGKTNPRILGNELVIANTQGETENYTIEINYGSESGGEGTTSLSGNITNLTDISGQLQDNETDLGRHGFVRAYSSLGELLNEVETDVSGNFSLRIPNPISEYFLQARIVENGLVNSYVRTREFNDGGDIENLVIRAVPYDRLAENTITPEQFKAYMSEIQFDPIRKWDLTGTGETSNPFQGIEIVDVNPITGDYFILEEQNFIRDTMLANINCYTGGMLTEENTFVQIDDSTSNVNYTYDSVSGIIPNSGWMVVASESNLGGAGALVDLNYNARQIIKARIRIHPVQANNVYVVAHEEGHGFIAPPHLPTLGHTSYENSIMNEEGLFFESPSEIDCKAGYLVNEPNYTVMDPEFPRYLGEKQERILGLEFGNFN